MSLRDRIIKILSTNEWGFKMQNCEAGRIKDSSNRYFRKSRFSERVLVAFRVFEFNNSLSHQSPSLRRVSIHNVQNCHKTFSRQKNPLAILWQSVRQSDFYAGFLDPIVDRILSWNIVEYLLAKIVCYSKITQILYMQKIIFEICQDNIALG